MSIPGLNAEASLYKTSGHYHMTETCNGVDGVIRPAYLSSVFIGTVSCFGRCLGNCPSNSSGRVSRDCVDNCTRACGGRPFIPSVFGPLF
jgi:hypothetical protein